MPELSSSAFDAMNRLSNVEDTSGAVWRNEVNWGDRLTIVTRNSVYKLIAIEDDSFIISGGWFDAQNVSPATVKIAGCTCGGAVINRKLIAAPGFHLEVANRIVTTAIQQVVHERFDESTAN